MPILIDPDANEFTVLAQMLSGTVEVAPSLDRVQSWLAQHPDEYAVVVGSHVPQGPALALCTAVRSLRPSASVILVRGEVSTEVLTLAIQAGARDVIPTGSWPAVAEAVGRAKTLASALHNPEPAQPRSTVLTVWSPKGGVGKTTLAVNLAVALTENPLRSVCLVDLDLAFGDVSITMQLFPAHSIEDAAGSEDNIDSQLLEGLLTTYNDSVRVLAAPARPDARERITPKLVDQILRVLQERFDVVVIDTAPTLDDHILTALDHTHQIVIVAGLDVPTLKNVKVALETLDLVQVSPEARHLVINRSDDATGIKVDRIETILGLAPEVLLTTSATVAAATNEGIPIVLKEPQHPISVAIRALAASVLGDESIVDPSAGRAAPSGRKQGRRLKKRR